ncbi:MAG: hypothetical protein JRD87_17275 [Deltaproteobacteria bacterium]|nr:hypothetical protein [Deltaproteobacteria bacterium]
MSTPKHTRSAAAETFSQRPAGARELQLRVEWYWGTIKDGSGSAVWEGTTAATI